MSDSDEIRHGSDRKRSDLQVGSLDLGTDLADTLLLKLGIRSYNGLIKCENLNDELLSIHDSISENDRAHLFLYHNTLSSSRPTEVIPGILRELILFEEECKKQINNRKIDQIILSGNTSSIQGGNEQHNMSKRLKINCNSDRSIMFSARLNDITGSKKFKYREKPSKNEDHTTDWSFDQDELITYDSKSDHLNLSDAFIVKETTHTYVTQQRINHFFTNRMKIKPEEIQKCVYLIQYALAWHIEQVYEFTMRVRTSKSVVDHFSDKFQNYNFEEDDVKKKVKLLVDFIKETKYKPGGYN